MNRPQTGREDEMVCQYLLSAAIGPVEVLVEPTVTVHVLRKGSVLDTLISNCAEAWVIVGSRWQRVAVGSKE